MNGQRDIRLLLSDVDGTLVTQGRILTEMAQSAARELRSAGIMLALSSSRPPRGMSMLTDVLSSTRVVAGFNGGLIVHPDYTVISSHTLDLETAQKAVTLMADRELDVWVYTERDWFVRNPDAPHVAHEAQTVQFRPQVVSSFTDAQLADAVKIVGISDDPLLIAACEKKAPGILGDQASVTRSQPYYLEVTNALANKGEVVRTISRLLAIPPEQIATIGDMPTDVLMFRSSGFSIAMGNASDEVKAQASVVTDSNENEGFAKAVQNFILK